MWLTRFKYPQGQLARWLEELSQYDMEIVHRPGKKHLNADALSRLPDTLRSCDCYHAGLQLSALPCGGCAYCTRAFNQWERFENDVDDVIPLAIRELTVVQGDQEESQADLELVSYSMLELTKLQEQDPDIQKVVGWVKAKIVPSQAELSLYSQAVTFIIT